ncbi:UDP-glucose dehydrogenase family protein [Pelagibacterium halotolerans]|uniref:UDP-glucose 6-dehydrogenase n=1 Tax=Pelagibacterium halotolerans (strain DSM 22347 / JCM 15775 / CGMCC 1.7692 / B2) TaxID=1082931 RepID=G4RGX6_PELHB|nr:UDP-glucose/GDP-mannose dehydrogenase family protein [Pelagibacterium halotolerans]AEQ53129.1 UDP-glucose dehydrogenase [Pelagibacterium halotolerans B2]QJR17231.1 UDP-glucose/GDP-mannose dehydrogenase family protein [Pelagibacterium halotolerans]SEA88557.1 UDPglucose 6-dehydrogenase [Pelagibacterium halotolerans]
MRLTIFGTGYVGLVTGACLADVGHQVICVDVDAKKIARLRAGEIPIHEPGLDEVVHRNVAAGTLEFTTDTARAVAHGQVQFVAVGTPPDESGAADLQYVLAVAETIGKAMARRKIVVVKSTVPVGTSDKVRARLAQVLSDRNSALEFDVVSNPEFLKEGAAVNDFLKPDRIIVGTATDHAREVMKEIYEPFNRNHDRTIYMDVRSAELTKYAANAMLATKISFINEIANLAERLGADIEEVRRGIGADPRIGYHFIYPGLGYGGSCFPKDVQALGRTARDIGYDAPLIGAVEAVNTRQKTTLFEKMANHFGGAQGLKGKRIAVWGLAFKPNTDDMREAPSRVLIEALWAAGATVVAYDPVAMDETARIYGARDDLMLAPDKYAALEGADALAICTEWQQFRAPDFDEMADRLAAKLIFDGRNIYAPDRLSRDGWTYVSVGRAPAYPQLQAVENVS